METLARELHGILRREIRSFTSILELLMLEEKELISCNADALRDILARQEDVLSSIACLEKSRIQVIGRIADDLGIPLDGLTVNRIAGYPDAELAAELEEAGHVLKRLTEEIQRRKRSNALLINQSLMMIEGNIRLICRAAGIDDVECVYSGSVGDTGVAVPSIRIDQAM